MNRISDKMTFFLMPFFPSFVTNNSFIRFFFSLEASLTKTAEEENRVILYPPQVRGMSFVVSPAL